MFVVVQDFFLAVLAFFDVDDAHLQLGLDEHLENIHSYSQLGRIDCNSPWNEGE